MSKPVGMPVYVFTVYTVEPTGIEWDSGMVTAAYFQEAGAYTVFKDAEHAVVEAYKTAYVSRIVRTEKPLV